MSDAALALHSIDKRFGEVQALANASLVVRRGTIHAVLGENGAGKTTLMRIAFGMLRPDAGHVDIDGIPAALTLSADAIQRGLGMVHQHFTLVPAMTAAENVALGGHGLLDLRGVARRVHLLAERTGLPVDPAVRVETLGVGAQQRVEILKALYGDAHLLILDEPSAVLTPQEAAELFAWLRRFVTDGGTVVLVTHKLQEALSFSDDITVLRRGRCVLTAPTATLDLDTIVRAVTGDEPEVLVSADNPRVAVRGDCVARLRDASVRDSRGVMRLRNATVDCFSGEIVGIAGVEGSGVHELLRLLAGRLAPSTGAASLPVSVGFIPEDRLRDAIIEDFTLSENLMLQGAGARTGRMHWPLIASRTAGVMHRHGVRAPTPAVLAGTLSGGNQQKFVVGREVDDRPALVVAESPVRGLDIRATEHVMRELLAAATAGSAVLLYSADIDELLPVVERMLVVFAGTVREVPVDRTAVVRALVGAS